MVEMDGPDLESKNIFRVHCTSSLHIRLHMCESVCPPGHLVPGQTVGLTIGKSGTNLSKQ